MRRRWRWPTTGRSSLCLAHESKSGFSWHGKHRVCRSGGNKRGKVRARKICSGWRSISITTGALSCGFQPGHGKHLRSGKFPDLENFNVFADDAEIVGGKVGKIRPPGTPSSPCLSIIWGTRCGRSPSLFWGQRIMRATAQALFLCFFNLRGSGKCHTAMNAYEAKLEQFQGPLPKLLELIEARRLEVSAISLGEVTADFLAYLEIVKASAGIYRTACRRDAVMADFLAVASRLVLLKSKSLIPSMELSAEEQEDMKNLEARLKEYREMKPLFKAVGTLWSAKKHSFARAYFLHADGGASRSGILGKFFLSRRAPYRPRFVRRPGAHYFGVAGIFRRDGGGPGKSRIA